MIEKKFKIDEDLNLKSKTYTELVDKQYELELNTAAGIENRKTGKQFTFAVNAILFYKSVRLKRQKQ